MNIQIETARKGLEEKLAGKGFDGSIQVLIEGEGAFFIDEHGVHDGKTPADCTLSANADTFAALLAGELHPTSAFMSGKLRLDGDMSVAMKLGSLLG